MLCDVCLGIFRGTGPRTSSRSARRDAFEAHHNSISSLRASYLVHCHICVWLRRLLPEGTLQEVETVVKNAESTDPITRFHLSVQQDDEPYLKYDLRFIVSIPLPGYPEKRAAFELIPSTLVDDVAVRPLSDFTGSKEALQLAKHWVENCTSRHGGCNRKNTGFLPESGFLPKRLLDVGVHGSEMVKLCITEEDQVKGPYITLSHCWGDAIFLKLTQNTASIFRKGIPIQDLPTTFRDAIYVCRELGVKYIWIDSLCIFQDSRADWRAQSSVMGHVYRGGVCNIAATGAHNSDEGLFFNRDGVAVSVATVTTKWTDQTNKSFVLYQKDGIWIDLNSTRLLQRAWVVQERYMAKRVLHFNRKELLWECSTLSACERFPSGISYPHMRGNPFGALRTRDFFWLEAERTARGWRRLVDVYSHCDMTRHEDKLVALSGIVKQIQSKRGDAQYHAGLWSTSLFEDLLWRVRQPTAAPAWRAPSWSWACLDGIVNWPKQLNLDFKLAQYPASLLDVQLTYPSADPTGEVLSGTMSLRGPVVTLTLQLESTTDATPDSLASHIVYVNGKWLTLSEDSLAFDWAALPTGEPQLRLLLLIVRRSALRPDKRLSNAGILLVRAETAGVFKRVGRVFTYDKTWVNGLPSDLGGVRNEDWLAEELGEQSAGEGNVHSITIE